jgi:hypothetical protein
VSGFVGCDELNYEAIILGLSPEQSVFSSSTRFTVQPIAINYIEVDGASEPLIICRFVTSYLIDEATRWEASKTINVKKPEQHKTQLALEMERARPKKTQKNGLVVGAHGVLITLGAFLEATDEGCSVCQEVIGLNDADDMFWLDDEGAGFTYPICEGCSASLLWSDQGLVSSADDSNVITVKQGRSH